MLVSRPCHAAARPIGHGCGYPHESICKSFPATQHNTAAVVDLIRGDEQRSSPTTWLGIVCGTRIHE